ncbi:MAG: VOC family protein [Acidobacteriota bacterium]
MKGITPFLWFDNKAEEAANLYTSLFEDSRILSVSRYGEAGPGPKGSAMTVSFQLRGEEFVAMNGGPLHHFTPAVSFVVHCKTQPEVDRFWDTLSEGGKPGRCGWLEDRYGLSWQIVPSALMELMRDKDPKKSQAVMKAMMQMNKIEITELERAHNNAQAE